MQRRAKILTRINHNRIELRSERPMCLIDQEVLLGACSFSKHATGMGAGASFPIRPARQRKGQSEGQREISSTGSRHPGGAVTARFPHRLTSRLRSWVDTSAHSLIPRPRTRSVGDCRGQTRRDAETDQ